eukprot:scaffold2928_cov79-Cylindrotheca_fusiformis.AAC.1
MAVCIATSNHDNDTVRIRLIKAIDTAGPIGQIYAMMGGDGRRNRPPFRPITRRQIRQENKDKSGHSDCKI